MKHTRLMLCTSALALAMILFSFAVFAEDLPAEGSDLPVSESYVIRALNALEEKLNRKIDALAETIGTLSPETAPEAGTEAPETTAPETETEALPAPEPPVTAAYTVEYLKKGQSIVGNCELILRSGTAEALCPGANGISDLTDGADLAGKTEIARNHLLLVPRDDGRGLTVTSEDAYIMVRGTYQITPLP